MYIKNNGIAGRKEVCIGDDEKSLEVPGCMLYSRGGMVPHLTKKNLEMITKENIICQIPLSTFYEQPGMKVMEEFGESFHKFSSSKEQIYVLNTNDSYLEKVDIYSYNEEKSISIWAPGGRRKITPEEYMKYFSTFQFDICIPPSDNIPEGCSKKRCFKSVDRTIKFLDKCLLIKQEKELKSPLLGVIEGGDSLVEREKCAKEVAKRNVDGYVLSGFDRLIENWKEILEKCLVHLDKEKPKLMTGIFTPLEVIEAVQFGVHLFDSVIAYDVTQRSCALSFKYNTKKKHVENSVTTEDAVDGNSVTTEDAVDGNSVTTEDAMDGNSVTTEDAVNGNSVTTEDAVGGKMTCKKKHLSEYEYNLKDKRYFDDTRPVVEGCSCYCCSRYVRAYLHHLLTTNEMLAQVLLMIHNVHHWLAFFKEIQRCIKEDTLTDLIELIAAKR